MSFLLWIGISFLVTVLVVVVRQDLPLLMQRRVRTVGTVVGHRRSVDDGSEYFMAKVAFTAEDGRSIEIEDSYGTGVPKPAVGGTLPIVYPAGAPELGRVRRVWLRLMLYGFLGATLGILVGRISGRL